MNEPTPAIAPEEAFDGTWMRAYSAPFPTQTHAAGAIGWAKGFATRAHRFEMPDASTRKELAGRPTLAIWGEMDRTLRAEHFLPLFKQAFLIGCVHRLPGVGHCSPEDGANSVTHLVSDFLENGR